MRGCFAGSADKTLRKWDIFSGSCKTVYEGHEAVIHCVLVHQLSLFSSSYDKTARHWNIKTGECLQVYTGHQRAVSPLIFVNLSVADKRTERRKSRVKMERKMSTASQLMSEEHKSLLISGSYCACVMSLHALPHSLIGALQRYAIAGATGRWSVELQQVSCHAEFICLLSLLSNQTDVYIIPHLVVAVELTTILCL